MPTPTLDEQRAAGRRRTRDRLVKTLLHQTEVVNLTAWLVLYLGDRTLPPPPGGPAHWRRGPLTTCIEA